MLIIKIPLIINNFNSNLSVFNNTILLEWKEFNKLPVYTFALM